MLAATTFKYLTLALAAGTAAWGMPLEYGECDVPIRFGDSYDRFLQGRTPALSELEGTRWVLTGVAGSSMDRLGWGPHYDSTGYEIEGSVPSLQFLSRGSVAGDHDGATLVSWSDAQLFARWQPSRRYDELMPTFSAERWPERHGPKRDALVFSVSLFGPEADSLHPPAGNKQAPSARLYLYCRTVGRKLLCLTEHLGETPRVTNFIWLERR